jgi:hypothetical protein
MRPLLPAADVGPATRVANTSINAGCFGVLTDHSDAAGPTHAKLHRLNPKNENILSLLRIIS